MNIALDVLVVGIIAVSVIIGYARGLIKSVMGLVSGILAIVLALIFTPMLSKVIDENLIHPALSGFVEEKIAAVSPTETPEDDIEGMIEDKPSGFGELLDSFGVTFNELKEALFGSGTKSSETAETPETSQSETGEDRIGKDGAVGSILENAAGFISSKLSGIISSVIAFIVIYIVALILLRIITFLLEGLLGSGTLKTSDKVLGAVFGLVAGAVSCVCVCTVVAKLLPYLANSDSAFFANVTADKTLLFKYFSDIGFIKEFIGGIIK